MRGQLCDDESASQNTPITKKTSYSNDINTFLFLLLFIESVVAVKSYHEYSLQLVDKPPQLDSNHKDPSEMGI